MPGRRTTLTAILLATIVFPLSAAATRPLYLPAAAELVETFGNQGVLLLDQDDHSAAGRTEVAVFRDGGMVVAMPKGLYRYDAQGRLAASFGRSGFARYPRYGDRIDHTAVQRTPAGKLLVSGYGGKPRLGIGTGRTRLFQFRDNGKLDSGFGNGGVVRLPGDSQGHVSMGRKGHLLALSAIPVSLLTGGGTDVNEADTYLTRLTTNGSVDMSFGDQGSVRVDAGGKARQLHELSDGSVLLASGNELHKFDPTGAVDATFGSAGKVQLCNDKCEVEQHVFLPDGTLVSAGSWRVDNHDRAFILKHTRDGKRVRDFGTRGKVLSAATYGDDAVVDANGRVLLLVTRFLAAPRGHDLNYSFIERYDRRGRLDRSFGEDGAVRVSLDHVFREYRMIFMPDLDAMAANGRRLIVSGEASPTRPGRPAHEAHDAVFIAVRA